MENSQEIKEVKVQTKEWSNPTPAGLVALAAVCFCFFGQLTGLYNATESLPLLGCWLIGGFLVQVIVGLLDLKSGNLPGGNTFLFFSAFFMFVNGLEMFYKYKGITSGAPLDARIDGYAWIALTLVMLLWTPAFLKTFSLLSCIILAVDVALPFKTLLNLAVLPADFVPVAKYIAGIALLVAGIFAVYLSAALVVNGTFGKEIYPTIKPKKK
jgi:succinate-acetate transporter protein